jgi:hypothetical protein
VWPREAETALVHILDGVHKTQATLVRPTIPSPLAGVASAG